MTERKQSFSFRRLLPLIVILVVAAIGYLKFGEFLSFATLADNHEKLMAWREANTLLAAATFVAAYASMVTFSLPGAAIATLTGGFLFGFLAGTALNVTGATLGALGIFLAAKTGLGDYLSARIDADEGRVGRIRKGIAENEVSYLLMMRLIPAVPFFVANLIPALIGVKFRTFVWTTFIGIIPGGCVYTSLGSGLGEILARGERPDLGIIFEWQILLPILGLAALASLPIFLKSFGWGTSNG